jgi:hypothetical protein
MNGMKKTRLHRRRPYKQPVVATNCIQEKTVMHAHAPTRDMGREHGGQDTDQVEIIARLESMAVFVLDPATKAKETIFGPNGIARLDAGQWNGKKPKADNVKVVCNTMAATGPCSMRRKAHVRNCTPQLCNAPAKTGQPQDTQRLVHVTRIFSTSQLVLPMGQDTGFALSAAATGLCVVHNF